MLISEDSKFFRVIGDLPYYLPFPENFYLTKTNLEDQKIRLNLLAFKPLRHPDDSSGDGIDDRKGTFLRSRVIIDYFDEDFNADSTLIYTNRTVEIVNRLIDSIRYKMNDFTIRPITHFDHFLIKFGVDQTVYFSEGMDYGPFGLTPQRTINTHQAHQICDYFVGNNPMNPAKLLLLDAKYHNMMNDFNRAILDIGIAVEIHIEWLLNYYSKSDISLLSLFTENTSIWDFYKKVLKKATGYSLEENEDIYIAFESLRYLRNSVAHEWKPRILVDTIKDVGRRSKHLEEDGLIVDSREKMDDFINRAEMIVHHVEQLFTNKYDA
ncbi:MAG: hypothetical protein PWQ55_1150 [Chloroflexota bacterium]|nr:hypothetical protein [Chloroflexota bacterium]